jgi:hypothetical protein
MVFSGYSGSINWRIEILLKVALNNITLTPYLYETLSSNKQLCQQERSPKTVKFENKIKWVNREKERDIMHTAKSKQRYPYGKTEQVRQFKLDKK